MTVCNDKNFKYFVKLYLVEEWQYYKFLREKLMFDNNYRLTSGPYVSYISYFLIQSPTFPYFLTKNPTIPTFWGVMMSN